MRIVCGEAGVGKTRLALQTAAEHRADGGEWRLVQVGEEADAIRAARAATAGPLLLVVDRAETRPGLHELLRALPEDPGPVRVLLIARVLGEWWDRLVSASEPAVSRLLTETEPLQLTIGVSEDASDADLAKAALPHFARALSAAGPRQVTVAPADRRVPLLVVHAATLVALLRFYTYPVATLRVVISDDALDELLEHEARYWLRSASAAGLPAGATLVKQVLAASSLLGAGSVEEAADIVARVPDLGDRPAKERLRWAQWLGELYPAGSDRRLGELQPEMVAETYVVGQLSDDPALARSCLRGLSAERAEHALAVLARAWAHSGGAGPLIAAALRDDLAGLGVPAGRVAQQVRGDLGGLLADALDDTSAPPEVLTDIARNLPYPSTVLARTHHAATARVRESLPADTKPETVAEWDARATRLLSELGHDAGRPPAPQVATPQRPISWASPARARRDPGGSRAGPAVETAAGSATPAAEPASRATAPATPVAEPATRAAPAPAPAKPAAPAPAAPAAAAPAAAPAEPSTAAPVPATPVAEHVAVPAAAPSAPARPEDRATTTHRASAASPTTPAAEPAKPGRPGEPDGDGTRQPSARKAAKPRRAASRADRRRSRPAPQGSADSAASAPAKPATPARKAGPRAADQETAGRGRASAAKPATPASPATVPPEPPRPEDPVPGYLEAVAAYRELAETHPGRYRADLATALTNLGLRLAELGRPGEALEAGREALAICRELEEADPASFRAELATCLVSLGIWFSELGRTNDALKAEQEAVSIRRELVATDAARYRPDLATSLVNLGVTLSELGRPAAAVGPVGEAVTIYRDLAGTDPSRYQPDLARCLANLAIRYGGLDRPAEALPPSEEAVTLRRELARSNPDRHRPDLARSLVNLAIRYCGLGRAADAVPAGQEAVALYRELAAVSPGYRRELARALSGLAAALGALGREAEAERAAGEAAEITQDLEHSRAAVPG